MKSSAQGWYNEALGSATNRTDLSGMLMCSECGSISTKVTKISLLFYLCDDTVHGDDTVFVQPHH